MLTNNKKKNNNSVKYSNKDLRQKYTQIALQT